MNTNANQKTQEAREPLKVQVDPIPFDGLIKSKLVTTIDLGRLFWNLFRPIFPEYEGCVILPDQYGQLQVAVYFKDKGKLPDQNAVKAITPIGVGQTSSSAYERIAILNQRTASRKFELTQDAKDVLSEFYWTRDGKVNWGQVVQEVTSQDYNGYSVHLKVTGLDINKIIRKIYGSKVNGGSRVEYAVMLAKPIGADPTGLLANYLISIQQLDTKEVENLAREVGLIPVSGTIPMLRG